MYHYSNEYFPSADIYVSVKYFYHDCFIVQSLNGRNVAYVHQIKFLINWLWVLLTYMRLLISQPGLYLATTFLRLGYFCLGFHFFTWRNISLNILLEYINLSTKSIAHIPPIFTWNYTKCNRNVVNHYVT